MRSENVIEPTEVIAGTAVQAISVKSLLENAEIKAYLKDEFTGVLYPWHTSPGGVGALKVFVSSEDLQSAKMVVEDYESKLKKE